MQAKETIRNFKEEFEAHLAQVEWTIKDLIKARVGQRVSHQNDYDYDRFTHELKQLCDKLGELYDEIKGYEPEARPVTEFTGGCEAGHCGVTKEGEYKMHFASCPTQNAGWKGR